MLLRWYNHSGPAPRCAMHTYHHQKYEIRSPSHSLRAHVRNGAAGARLTQSSAHALSWQSHAKRSFSYFTSCELLHYDTTKPEMSATKTNPGVDNRIEDVTASLIQGIPHSAVHTQRVGGMVVCRDHSLLCHAVNVAGSGGRRVLTILHEAPL